MKLKEKHFREPGMEDNPPPPNKKLKRWHNLKEKKRKKPRVFEKLSTIEIKEDVTPPAFDNAVDDRDSSKDNDKDSEVINPFPIFVFNATQKDVKVKSKTRKSRVTGARKIRGKGTTFSQTNTISSYFTTSRGSTSNQTSFRADSILEIIC